MYQDLHQLIRYTRINEIVGDVIRLRARDVALGDMAVVENTNGGLNALSLVTRFGHRYRVVSPRFARNVIKKDAERLARYFDVPVKEGTRGVIPCARAGKSAVLKWKKRPKTTLRAAFLVLLLALPLIVHIAGPLVEKLKGAAP